MKNKKKKFSIIIILIIAYLVIAGGFLVRDKVFNIKFDIDTKPEQQEETDNNTGQADYDYQAAYEELIKKADYDISAAPMTITPHDCASIIEVNALPALERMDEKDRNELMGELQVLKKIDRLNIDTHIFETPEFNWKNVYNSVYATMEKENSYENKVIFKGNKSSELNDTIKNSSNAYITIKSDSIILDETIELKSGIGLYAEGVKFVKGDTLLEKAIVAHDCENISLDSVKLNCGGYKYGIYLINTRLYSIESCSISAAEYKGITVMGNSDAFVIKNSTVTDNGNGAVFFNGNIKNGIIENNDIINNKGTRNLTAGLVLTSMEIEDYETAYNVFKDEHLYDLINTPHDIVIYQNRVGGNNSSGIYSDGAYQIYILENTITDNDKEGMCLDYGTFGAYVKDNIIRGNGGRKRQSDEDLEADFVLSFGRLLDSSSPAKLPGISIDNSAYNTLVNNTVTSNYGSGIKMVRSAYRNLIMENVVADNDNGRSDNFHFFGIEVGHASTPDEPVKGLDFTADYENIICRNTISGRQYAGVFLAEDSYCNDVFNNVIMNSEFFSIEKHSVKFNSIIDNIVNQKNLNVN